MNLNLVHHKMDVGELSFVANKRVVTYLALKLGWSLLICHLTKKWSIQKHCGSLMEKNLERKTKC